MARIGKYELAGELGTGSMGVIYRARDTILERDVALKTIAGGGALDPELKERFYREAKAGARLNHPNVVTVYELGEQDGLLFIALELLSGCDLRQFINERRTMPVDEKIEVIAGVCEGLQHAHESGIIHRDMKPSNIFLTTDGVGKILDFGVARLSASQLTVLGRVLGTPFYMAPEQILGKPCDARSDLFSVALVAFEFLTYTHPFAGESIPKRIINDQPDSLSERNPSLPRSLEPILAKALAKEPAQRYQSAGEFARELRGVLRETLPVVNAPAPAPPPPSPMLQNASTEFKMSEILAALQEFDLALEQPNVAAARAAMARIDHLAKADDRFATAAKESLGRLEALEARLPQPVIAAPPPPVQQQPPVPMAARPVAATPAPKPPPPPATLTRVQPEPQPQAPSPTPAGAGTISSAAGDVTSFFAARPAAPADPPPAATRTPTPSSPPRVQEAATPPKSSPPAPPAAPAKSGGPVLIMGIAAAAVVIITLGVFFILRPTAAAVAVPALATAEVAADQAAIMSDPSDSAKVVVNLKKGDSVNVIRPPRSRTQEWTEVQFISPSRTYPAGTIKTATLTNWKSDKSDVALYLIEMNAPADTAGEADLRAYQQKLSGFLDRFPGAPERAQAQTDLEQTTAALSRLAAPQPQSPAPAATVASESDPAAILARAQRLWEQGQYDGAERLLKQLLVEKPDFGAAKQLLDRVQKARALEGGK